MDALQSVAGGFSDSLLIWFGVFVRVAAVAFFLPGIGERAVPARVKLGGALAMSAIVIPMVAPFLPSVHPAGGELARVYGAEVIAGLAIGVSIRMLIFAIQTAGTIAAQNLSVAQMFGAVTSQEPEPVIATFLTLAAIAAALAAGLHVKAAAALALSYDLIPYGLAVDAAELGAWASDSGRAMFDLAIGLALPFIVIAFLYNMALGAINRAMPQLMVAFVGAPAITGIGIGLLMLTAPIILSVWLEHLDTVLATPFELYR